MSRLYAIDANSLGAWQHYAVSDSSGHQDMLEGVRAWWREFSERLKPEMAVACFDCSRESNWRKKLFVEYKSGRDSKPPDEALRAGFRELPAVFESLSVPTLRMDGYEADDLIATLTARYDGPVIVVTSDKDLMQLVDDRVQVYDPRPNKAGECVFYDEAAVEQKLGVPPHRLREYLAIKGDTADSIPGVKGLGDVFSRTAIRQTKSKAEMLRKLAACALADISKKNQEKFNASLADFEMSYNLVGLKFDAPIPEDFSMQVGTKRAA